MDIKITGVTFEIMRDALAQAKVAREFILGEMATVIDAPRARAVQVRAADLDGPDRPREDRAADRQGRRDDPRARRRSSSPRSTSTTRAWCSSTPPTGERGDALVDRIRSMTKEVEVGDEFTGKVVKTTTFGAFVELSKGTDGLLHISNVAPGPPDRHRRGGAQQGRRGRGQGGRGRPRARPHRPAPRRRSRDPGQDQRRSSAAIAAAENGGAQRRDRPPRDRDRAATGP